MSVPLLVDIDFAFKRSAGTTGSRRNAESLCSQADRIGMETPEGFV